MSTPGRLPSPCVRRCCLDGDQCLGCGRLMSEILEWAQADEDRQRQITDLARARQLARDSLSR